MKYQKIGCFVLMLISLILPLVKPCLVQAKEKSRKQSIYQPQEEEDETVTIYRQPAGTRGGNCNSIPTDIISLIIPDNHIAKTISDKPTILLYSSQDIGYPVEVTFYSLKQGTLFTSRIKNLNQGFMGVTIPEDSPGLKIGELAKFTATIVCNEKHPSMNLYVQGWIERTDIPKLINQDIIIRDCNIDYAELGIWYDALACAYSQLNNIESVSVFEDSDFNSLLEQIDLAELKIKNSEFINLVENP